MTTKRGNAKEGSDSEPTREPEQSATDEDGRIPGLSDLARRMVALGLSGFFSTEETIRKALGDTLPKDWSDFAIDQSERTRKEFLERLSFELAQTLEKIDVAAVMNELLEGRTVEVRAEIRLGERGSETQKRMHVNLADDVKK
ncbi:MAG: hypothetical protein QF890_10680 [Myxococcota bacterium]|nr:hypothetical protein [Deltaproteobacteria bacterium]MCP4240887.1 hypothetical protein [bacterium]MDP6075516.1 hypothetical protein [Myxococcota bacterium]MDP6242821.1 hypothetical protein [Myxococcota bacterium]MDP7075964.1 hypothetical protein [Myxococcota bacterium]